MSENSAIAWTDHTFNGWWGCTRISPECQRCYAETFAKRTGNAVWGEDAPRRFFGDKHWREPLKWNADATKAGVRARVFCSSMSDVFEDREDLVEHRARLFDLIDATPNLDWQLLTKRPQHMLAFAPSHWGQRWPGNLWAGTTVGIQSSVGRVAHLRRVPAAVRFLSCEPLLGPLELDLDGISWVIIGGESGAGFRPLQLEWIDSIVAQARAAGVAVFIKQDCGLYPGRQGRIPDGVFVREFPVVTP